jgi:hypothetical protein
MSNWLKSLAVASLAALAPIQAVLVVVGLLLMSDMVLGILAARKRGEVVNSASMRRTVSKMLIYEAVVILGYLMQHYLMDDIMPVAKICAGAIGMVEFKSILENADAINGGSVLKTLISKLGSANDTLSK